MPRPKRSKVAPSAPSALVPTKASSSLPQHNPSSQSSRSTTNSDDSDGLVTRNKSGLNRRGIARKEVHMSGALLVPTDGEVGRSRPLSGKTRAELFRVAREADYMERNRPQELSGPRGTANGQSTEKPEIGHEDELQEELLVPSSMPEEKGAAPVMQSIVKDIVPGTAEEARKPVEANWRSQATPKADTSVYAISNFRPRSRQPSLLNIGRQDDSVSLSSLGGGGGGLGSDFDDLYDLEPQDESTPFHANTLPPQTEARSSHALSSTPAPVYSSSIGSRKRKITPPEVLVPQSQSPRNEEDPARRQDLSGLDISEDEAGDREPALPSPKRSAVSPPTIWSDTMAPPQSSSPIRSQESVLARQHRQPTPAKAKSKRGRKPKNAEAALSTNTIVEAGSRAPARTKKKPLKPISTATLQNLLPRRRMTRHLSNDLEIPSSPEPPSDDDELSFAPKKSRRKPTTVAAAKSKLSKRTTMKNPVPKTPARALPSSKTRAKNSGPISTTATNPSRNKRVSKTYSRLSIGSDKENHHQQHRHSHASANSSSLLSSAADPDQDATHPSTLQQDESISSSSSEPLPKEAKKVMRGLAKKFEEVDRWVMEFEEDTGSGSSPKNAW